MSAAPEPAAAGSTPAGMGAATRVTLFMSICYCGLGAILPYLPVWLEEAKGLSGAEIGVVLASANIARIVIGPMMAAWADGLADRRTPLIVLAIIALAAYGLMGPLTGFPALFVVGFVAGVVYQGMIPFVEAAALRATLTGRPSYGVARALASSLFIVGNLGAGALMQGFGPWAAYGWIAVSCLVLALAGALLPREPIAPGLSSTSFRTRLKDALGLVKAPGFLLLMIGGGLIQAAHAFYYGFSSLVWIDQGIPEGWVGALWGWGVAVEIVFLATSAKWLMRVKPEYLLLAGGIAAVVRWTAYAFSPPMWLLVPLQATHAMTFAATHLGSMRMIQRQFGHEGGPTAQTIYASLAMAPALGLATLGSGLLYDAVGAQGYLAMAAMGACGLAAVIVLARRAPAAATAPA